MRKFLLSAMITVLIAIALVGCGKVNTAYDSGTIVIQKTGDILGVIVESFSKPNYSAQELQTMAEKEIAEFNDSKGKEAVTVQDFLEKDGRVSSTYWYEDAAIYTEFNKKQLFFGTVADAKDNGYSFDTTLISTEEGGESIGEEEILAMSDMHIVILEEPVQVNTYGKILYMSDQIQLLDKKSAKVTSTDELSYMLIK